MDKVRIDKWLWAARFYKTRTLAKKAIETGKVSVDGQRPKPSRDLTGGETLALKTGWDEKTITVTALSDQRRSAPEAQLLYQESDSSIAKREAAAELRKQQKQQFLGAPEHRPTKKQRRQIHQFKNIHFNQE